MCENRVMKFRIGFATGLIIGFLLGARAGRERYEQTVKAFAKLRSNQKVRQTAEFAERSTRKSRAAAGNTLVGTADTIRQRAAR